VNFVAFRHVIPYPDVVRAGTVRRINFDLITSIVEQCQRAVPKQGPYERQLRVRALPNYAGVLIYDDPLSVPK
jgi:hypothetical protein